MPKVAPPLKRMKPAQVTNEELKKLPPPLKRMVIDYRANKYKRTIK